MFFNGVVSPELVKRVHRIGESGIWPWWVKIFKGNDAINANVDDVEVASIRGNIVVFICGVGGWYPVDYFVAYWNVVNAVHPTLCIVLEIGFKT